MAGAVAVRPEDRLVVTEGNYLLLAERPWSAVRELCDEIWYVDVPEAQRLEWLIARHMHFGRSEAQARERATTGSDAANAEVIGASAERADAWVSGHLHSATSSANHGVSTPGARVITARRAGPRAP